MLKVLALEVIACPRRDSRMQRVAVIAAILDCIRRKEEPP
jgi:hypothetical protein